MSPWTRAVVIVASLVLVGMVITRLTLWKRPAAERRAPLAAPGLSARSAKPPPVLTEAPASLPTPDVERDAFFRVRANLPIQWLLVGNREIELEPPLLEVRVPLVAAERTGTLRIGARSMGGHVTTGEDAYLGSDIELHFAALPLGVRTTCEPGSKRFRPDEPQKELVVATWSSESTDGFAPEDKLEVNANGFFSMWRGTGRIGGTFEGGFGAEGTSELTSEAVRANALGPLPPAGGYYRLRFEMSALGSSAQGAGALRELPSDWGVLGRHVELLRDDLTYAPRAAVSLDVSPDGAHARLSHHGCASAAVDFAQSELEVVLTSRVGLPPQVWTGPPLGPVDRPGNPHRVSITRGWTLALPFNHGFAVSKDAFITASVAFLLDEDGGPPHRAWVRLEASSQ